MKAFLLCLLLTSVTYTLQAQKIITVSNNPRIPAQFENLQAAINAALPGDTLYVHPSADVRGEGGGSSYGDVVLNKPLVLIGGGFNNGANEFFAAESWIAQIQITAAADNSSILYCYINRIFLENNNANDNTFNNLLFRYNYIDRIDFTPFGDAFAGTISLRNNLIGIMNFNNWRNFGQAVKLNIDNNILGLTSNGGGDGVVYRNNFFNPQLYGRFALNNTFDATFFNNIFYGFNRANGIGTANATGCIFDYNISFEVSDTFTGGTGNNPGANNISNLDPRFAAMSVNFTNTQNRLNSLMATNFTLAANSPAIGKGTNGRDIGLLGGDFPFFHRSRMPFPFVQSIQVSNPVVGENATLQFSIQAVFPTQQ